MTLRHRKILLGVTGSIAAYKACELTRLLVRDEAEVQVVMTASAERFVQPLAFEALSHRPVRTALFDRDAEMAMSHIELARWADLVVIAPASAQCLARLACGWADDLLGTLCLATRAPLVVAPAMNTVMWEHPATQTHVQTLRERDVHIIEPETGDQACGEHGPGRLPEPEQLKAELENLCPARDLEHLHVVITAGPTREALDPARFLSNFSTGRMGCAMAQAFLERGARVTLICGPLSVTPPAEAELVHVTTAAEMCEAALTHSPNSDIFIAAAAVADWRPATTSQRKLKKAALTESLRIEPTVDILSEVARQSQRPYLVGFAAETNKVVEQARTKLQAKGADLIVANRIGRQQGFGERDTTLHLVDAHTAQRLGPDSKPALARRLATEIATRMQTDSSVIHFPHAGRQHSHSG